MIGLLKRNEAKEYSQQLADQLLDIIFAHRRQVNDLEQCDKISCEKCRSIQYQKLKAIFQAEEKLTLILPAFPAKSGNRDKTIAHLPDLGEKLALRFLNSLCELLTHFYLPGVELVICSDGRVFNDLVTVSDAEVEQYNQAITDIIVEEKLTNLSLFSLDDCYTNFNFVAMREALENEYGESLEHLKIRTQNQSNAQLLFNGIHRFVFEDQLFFFPELSRNKVREKSKGLAYQVIQRSNAWSRLLEKQFPNSLRLSIHPQPCSVEKIGIQLLNTKNPWATPWHNVVLKTGNRYQLIKQNEAKELGAVFVQGNQNFSSHYVLPMGGQVC